MELTTLMGFYDPLDMGHEEREGISCDCQISGLGKFVAVSVMERGNTGRAPHNEVGLGPF